MLNFIVGIELAKPGTTLLANNNDTVPTTQSKFGRCMIFTVTDPMSVDHN